MSPLSTLYRHSLALLTDLYQLTMAYGYWKSGRHQREAVFHLYFRKNPFGGPFALAAGLDRVIEFITRCSPFSMEVSWFTLPLLWVRYVNELHSRFDRCPSP